MKNYFITGTGTDIGKTYILCSIVRQLIARGKSVNAVKPIISGFDINDKNSDSHQILHALCKGQNIDEINKISPWRFKEPLSPDIAANIENREIWFNDLAKFCHDNLNISDYNFIEGAGGIAVPINKNKNIIHLIKELNINVILVAGSYLGAISHTITCLETLKFYDIKVENIILNESSNSLNISDIRRSIANFTDVPILINKRNGLVNIEDINL